MVDSSECFINDQVSNKGPVKPFREDGQEESVRRCGEGREGAPSLGDTVVIRRELGQATHIQ